MTIYQGEPSAPYHSKNEANQLWSSELGRGEPCISDDWSPAFHPTKMHSIPAAAEYSIVDNGRAYQASHVLKLICNAQGVIFPKFRHKEQKQRV
jgi:hypothetical protein